MRSRSQRRWIILAILFLLIGCSRRMVPVGTWTPGQRPSWIGQPVERVLAVWGPNGLGEPDGLGGKIYSFHEDSMVTKSWLAPFGLLGPELVLGGIIPGKLEARFWIDAEGVVYRVWFSPNAWRGPPGKRSPPAELPNPAR